MFSRVSVTGQKNFMGRGGGGIHYHLYKSLLPITALSQLNPVHTYVPYLFNTDFNIIF